MAFHPGELDLQRRAGVQSMAEKVGRIILGSMTEDASDFLEHQRFVALGHRDDSGRVEVTLLTGHPGFMRAVDPRTLEVAGTSPAGGEAALLAVDFQERTRLRLNGILEPLPGGFRLRAKEVYWNCAKYIQARSIEEERRGGPAPPVCSDLLQSSQKDLIRRADTFFLATAPPGYSADVSHRGGNPGFVRILDGRRLEWDDYPGNAMFNTLGNLQLDPEAGLLYVDFEQGTLLQLNGRATVRGDRERKVEFEIAEIRETPGGHPFRWSPPDYSRFNPR
ncbi:MAG TPA: pyridoxamine 5'-phosphate oxidase family protein [Planctomycetota bacterium]|nr:pyridoxamine 5'-phosphate oxidase family protein [Planctomycetota bacterium]